MDAGQSETADVADRVAVDFDDDTGIEAVDVGHRRRCLDAGAQCGTEYRVPVNAPSRRTATRGEDIDRRAAERLEGLRIARRTYHVEGQGAAVDCDQVDTGVAGHGGVAVEVVAGDGRIDHGVVLGQRLQLHGVVVGEAAVGDAEGDIGRAQAEEIEPDFAAGGVEGGVGDRHVGRTGIVLDQHVAGIGADDADIVEAHRPQQVDEVHAVLFVLIADVGEVGIADAQPVDIVAIDAVLHAAVDGQVVEADAGDILHIHRGITAKVVAVGQVGARRCVRGNILGCGGVGQVHIPERNIVRVDESNA